MLGLVAGQDLGGDVGQSMPARRATASAAALLSPLTRWTSMPRSRSRRTAAAAVGLTGSSMSMAPMALPSSATSMVLRAAGASSSLAARRPARTARVHRLRRQEGAAADEDDALGHGGADAPARHRLEGLRLGEGQTAAAGLGDDGGGQRVLRGALRAGRQTDDLVLGPAGRGAHRG